MFRYYTQERKLHNLLWCWSPSATAGTSAVDYYPGGDWPCVTWRQLWLEPKITVSRYQWDDTDQIRLVAQASEVDVTYAGYGLVVL